MLLSLEEFTALRDPFAISWRVVTVFQDWLTMSNPRPVRRLCECGCQNG